ncbi:DUF4168 domain-containing protein [Desulfovermiculus halophilus]|uniref:DUF4168 domain-containing protein n=1 Tax=Desulfovermiculus halophilus TaxID=339722 RepID=UPI000480C5E3|nr:DUF4168 domain-containing protein [Desulfovermiculus halophilus]
MRRIDSRLCVVFGIAVSLLMFASSLQAQSQEGQGQNQYESQYEQNQPQPENFTDKELEAFVSARGEISELRQKFQPKFQEADDVDKAQQLREKFQNKAIQILDENGLDVQTYNNIVKGMDSNQKLRNKIEQKMGQ